MQHIQQLQGCAWISIKDARRYHITVLTIQKLTQLLANVMTSISWRHPFLKINFGSSMDTFLVLWKCMPHTKQHGTEVVTYQLLYLWKAVIQCSKCCHWLMNTSVINHNKMTLSITKTMRRVKKVTQIQKNANVDSNKNMCTHLKSIGIVGFLGETWCNVTINLLIGRHLHPNNYPLTSSNSTS